MHGSAHAGHRMALPGPQTDHLPTVRGKKKILQGLEHFDSAED